MKLIPPLFLFRCLWVGAATVFLAASLPAIELTSNPLGYNAVDLDPDSDTVIGLAFKRPASFVGKLGTIPSVNGASATLTPAGVQSLASLTSNPHYLRFTSGSRNGRYYDVTANDGTTITVDLKDDDLSGVLVDDTFEVIPHWTLGTLWPQATQTAIHESTDKRASGRKTSVLFFDGTTEGSALAAKRIYFLTSSGWFQSKSGYPAADDVIIPPDQAMIVRVPGGNPATTFYSNNTVHLGGASAEIRTNTSGAQDTAIALSRPVPVTLSDLDLGSAFADSAGTDAQDRVDELLVYDNAQQLINKQPSKTYIRVGGAWIEDDGNTFPNADNDEVAPSTLVIIRKAVSAGGASLQWLNLPRY